MAIAHSKEMEGWLSTKEIGRKNECILVLFEGIVWNVAHSCRESKFSHNVLRLSKKCLNDLILWRMLLYRCSIINCLFRISFVIICRWRRRHRYIFRGLLYTQLLLTVQILGWRTASCRCLTLLVAASFRLVIALSWLRLGDLRREWSGRGHASTIFLSGNLLQKVVNFSQISLIWGTSARVI